jgi:mannose-6-phosphate isomerase-like protein (cupin superfamily)
VSLKANYKAESHWHPYDIIQIFLEGEFKSEGEGSFYPGDIRWVKAGQSTIESGGSEGSRFYLIALGGNIPLMWDDLYEVPEDLKKTLQGRGSGVGKANINKLPFIPFEDEYGRPTQPVQVICNESPHIVRTTFDPTYTASDHWHKHDTMYFIMDGEMSFSDDEPIYKKGDVRVVKGGYSYGPEKPGKEGVTFILISNGGPIDLNWSDIKKPPLVN